MASVSVVMPVRNAAATVAAAVGSLRAQDLGDFEIVLVDHASDDDTPRILEDIARRDSRVRLLRHEGAFVEAANLAWREASGELVARMDADDFSHPSRLRRQRDFLLARPGLSGCASLVRILRRAESGEAIPPDGGYRRYQRWINSLVEPEEVAAQRFVDSPLPNPATMLRRAALEGAGGYADPPWAEDYDLWLRMMAAGHRFGKVAETLLDWHDAPGRATRSLERYSLARFGEAKAHHLALDPLVRERGVVVCGAGPIGKEMATRLRGHGVAVRAFLEVNVRQIGQRIGGIPVLASDRAAEFLGEAVMLAAVGREPGRERIRSLLAETGFTEGLDFFCVA
jgi:glycosyltransferase involved in cell wall biosynthesis